jgi:hypothetical protein
MKRRRLLCLAFIFSVAGCSATDRTAPAGVEPRSVIAASPTTIAGLPGELTGSPPSVQVVLAFGTPVPGVKVSFTFSDNRGSDYSTITDSHGFAVLENLRLDTRPGVYNIVASVQGVGSVTFSAISLSGKVISTYDLVAVGGRSGPPFVFSSASELGQLSGRHYQLFDDGTYRIGYVPQDQTIWARPARYIRRGDGVVEFYLDPSLEPVSGYYASRNYLFAIGTITGDAMKVAYQDSYDYEDEDYALAK